MTIPLIDGDVLLHELGWSAQFKDKDTGEEVLFDFDYTKELLDKKIALICEEVEATSSPIIWVSDSQWLTDSLNRYNRWAGLPERTFVPGFRYEVAKSKPYKGQRKNPKPFHFYNILVYLLAEYDTRVAENGLEADDEICRTQVESERDGVSTVICSRDKDLRICPGWHYSWECGSQASLGPIFTDEIGWLYKREKTQKYKEDGTPKPVEWELSGYGKSFFYAQMLTGDSADNIPGLPGVGKAAAFNLLKDLKTEQELFKVVQSEYKRVMEDKTKEYFFEQARLLWMQYDGPYTPPKKGK